MGYASVNRGFVEKNRFFKFIKTGMFMTYFFFNDKNAKTESKKFCLKNDPTLNRAVWNLLDTKGVKHALKGYLAGIRGVKFRKRLYVKKKYPTITIEYLKNLRNKIKVGNVYGDNNDDLTSHYLDDEEKSIKGDNLRTSIKKNEEDSMIY